jgi:molecular chaperone HtpG
MQERGSISIHTENILPIIKRWLYAEKEVFLRELVSNSADALTKLHKMSLVGEVKTNTLEPKITVAIDKDKKTLTITDTGLGMTADEIKKYINQVAFSGIQDFVKKYQGKDQDHQIIGHFGLGFYSSFMVADKVEIDTLSYQEGAEAVHWSCDGSTEFVLEKSDRTTIGTSIILHIGEDSKEMLDDIIVKRILNKYCAFIRYPIEMDNKIVNDPQPLWTKSPTTLTDKDYVDFFHKLFPLSPDPLFWIHINIDHPFKVSGILYFPKLKHELDASSGEVKLYCSQVYVEDNAKELVPEFLTLLKGAIDCPDLPLNVSRSALQNDPQVQLISQHISKKVADKLSGLAKTDQETYEKYWADIHPFIKFGMMRDHKFCERMQEYVIFKNSEDKYTNLNDYLERMKDKTDGKIIYASDATLQANYLSMFKDQGLEAIIAETMIDTHFLPFLEMETQRKYQFKRIDSDVSKHLTEQKSQIVDPVDQKSSSDKVQEVFSKYLSRPKVKVQVEALKTDKVPAMLIFDENARRLREMSRFAARGEEPFDPTSEEHTLVVNLSSPAIKSLIALSKGAGKDQELSMIVDQVYDLAYLQLGKFNAESMQKFVERSVQILEKVGGGSSASSIIL